MDYFKINYNKLRMLPQIKAFKIVIFTSVLLIVLIIASCFVTVYTSFTTTAIYEEDTLYINIYYEYTPYLKNGEYLVFNEVETSYTIKSISEYELVNGYAYQNIELELNDTFMNNEVGSVTIYYNKQKLLSYIFELFK